MVLYNWPIIIIHKVSLIGKYKTFKTVATQFIHWFIQQYLLCSSTSATYRDIRIEISLPGTHSFWRDGQIFFLRMTNCKIIGAYKGESPQEMLLRQIDMCK